MTKKNHRSWTRGQRSISWQQTATFSPPAISRLLTITLLKNDRRGHPASAPPDRELLAVRMSFKCTERRCFFGGRVSSQCHWVPEVAATHSPPWLHQRRSGDGRRPLRKRCWRLSGTSNKKILKGIESRVSPAAFVIGFRAEGWNSEGYKYEGSAGEAVKIWGIEWKVLQSFRHTNTVEKVSVHVK